MQSNGAHWMDLRFPVRHFLLKPRNLCLMRAIYTVQLVLKASVLFRGAVNFIEHTVVALLHNLELAFQPLDVRRKGGLLGSEQALS